MRRFTFFILFASCLSILGVKAEGVRYYHGDALGSIEVVTHDSGEVTDVVEATPFGEVLETPSLGEGSFIPRYTDQEWDPPIDLYGFGARCYDPVLSRFLSIDPIRDESNPQDLNLYSYAWNNPLRVVDPSGLEEKGAPQWMYVDLQENPMELGEKKREQIYQILREIQETTGLEGFRFVYRGRGAQRGFGSIEELATHMNSVGYKRFEKEEESDPYIGTTRVERISYEIAEKGLIRGLWSRLFGDRHWDEKMRGSTSPSEDCEQVCLGDTVQQTLEKFHQRRPVYVGISYPFNHEEGLNVDLQFEVPFLDESPIAVSFDLLGRVTYIGCACYSWTKHRIREEIPNCPGGPPTCSE